MASLVESQCEGIRSRFVNLNFYLCFQYRFFRYEQYCWRHGRIRKFSLMSDQEDYILD